MAVSLSVIAAKDSAGAAIAGGLQAQDKSGAGTGPFTLGQILIDGVAGTNMAQVTAANAVKVDGSAVTQPVSGTVTAAQATAASLNATVVGTGTFAVQAASTLAAETTKVIGTVRNVGNVGGIFDFAGQNAAAPANSLLIGAEFNTTPTTLISGNASPLQLDNAGNLLINVKAGVNANGRAAAASSAPVALSTEDNALLARLLPTATASGATASRVNAAATTNATSLKASAGQLYTIDVFNAAAYNVFLKLYNKASAPTVGTDTPVMTIPVQAGGGFSKTWPTGLPFATGIAYAITKLQADSDTTAVVAGDLTGNTTWI